MFTHAMQTRPCMGTRQAASLKAKGLPRQCRPRMCWVQAAAGLQEDVGATADPSEGGYIREGGDNRGGDRPQYDSNRGGDRPQYDRPQRGGRQGGRSSPDGERGSYSSSNEEGGGQRRSYGGQRRQYGDRQNGDRQYGDRQYGDRQNGDRQYGDRQNGDRQYGNRQYGDRQYGGDRQQQRRDRPSAAVTEEQRNLSARIDAADSWRQLNMLVETAAGTDALDAFRLVATLRRASRMKVADNADEQADFQQFVARVYGLLLEALPTCRPLQLALSVQGVASLQLYNEQLVGAILQKCLEDFDRFTSGELSLLMRSCAQLGVAPSQELMDKFWSKPFRITSRPGRPGQQDSRAARSTAEEVLGLTEALVKLGAAPPAEWLNTFMAASSRTLTDLGPREYLRFVLAVASCGWRPQDEETFGRLVERSFPTLQVMQVEQLSQLAWAFTQFQMPLPPQWGVAFNARLKSQRRFIRPASLGAILYSLAYLRMPPPQDAVEGYLEDLQIQYDDATGDDMANVAMAMAQFQYKPRERWLDEFLITLRRKLPTTTTAGLSTIVSALPALSSGVRLNEVASDAQRRLDAVAAAAQQQEQQQQQEQLLAADADAYAAAQ